MVFGLFLLGLVLIVIVASTYFAYRRSCLLLYSIGMFVLVILGFLVFINVSTLPLADAIFPLVYTIEWTIIWAPLFFSIGMLIGLGVLFVVFSMAGKDNERLKQRFWNGLLVFNSIPAIVVAVMIARQPSPYWIDLNRTGFSQQEVSITTGQMIRFANPATGIPLRLCLASGSECVQIKDGPAELESPGTIVAPGQVLHITFSTSGDYTVIIPTLPAMHLLIHVEEPDYHDLLEGD
jgi:hypothetical protein